MSKRHTEDVHEGRRPIRFSTLGSVLLSWDFLLGVPLGFGVALPAWCSPTVRTLLPNVLLAIAGFGVALAGLVLTALSVLLSTITPAYRRLLLKTTHGVGEITVPFQWVIGTSAASVALGLTGAMILPAMHGDWLAYLATAVPFAALFWAVLGCLQVSQQLIRHWSDSGRAQDAEDRIQRADH